MDGESSCESDISESWSLIDINEESLFVTETPSKLEETPPDVTSRKGSDIEIKDSVETFNETYETDFGPLKDSVSNSSFVSEDFVNCSNQQTEGVDSSSKRSGEDDVPHDSDDVESIEILDMDGNYRDSDISRLDAAIDSLDSQTYQSDDEEFMDESISNDIRNSSSTVIKRKKFAKDSQSPVNSVNNVDSLEKRDLKTCSTETETNDGESNEENRQGTAHPVLKHHHKSNVATRVLTWSLSMVVAGVACIAIGHFLGVQDAGETTGELVETLKKLKVENAALQSRLSHLNRVLVNREANFKSECRETPPGEERDLKGAALSEIRSSLSSIEWLSKLENLVRNDDRGVGNGVDLNSFRKYIQEQLDLLRSRKEGVAKLLEDADRRISRVVQKIVTRLSSSQENIENLYQRLTNMKGKLNKKVNKILLESPAKFEKRKSVTELDLHSDEKAEENPKSVVVYKFPQPEKYYQVEMKKAENVEGKPSKTTNSSEASKEKVGKEDKKSKHKKRNKEKTKTGVENKEKRWKHKPVAKQTEKEKRRKRKGSESEPEVTARQKMKYSKPKCRKMKKSKWRKPPQLKAKKNGKKRQERLCSMHRCLNSTGLWLFKWADGREEYRRQEALGDWLFERAKGREELRDEESSENWQFRRALGRESNRVRVRWWPVRGTRWEEKELFHDRFS